MQFHHNREDVPSSLTLDITVWNEFGKSHQARGKIDTGSDYTVIPDRLVGILDLRVTRRSAARTISGERITLSNYFVSIEVAGTKFESFEVLAMKKEYAILGRDLINLWKMVIDGEAGTFTIEPWSTNPVNAYRR